MNWKGTFLIGLAIFIGVFGALQADRLLSHKSPAPMAEVLPPAHDEVIPAGLDTQSDSGPLDFRVAAKKVIPSVVSVDRYEQMTDFFGDPVNQIAQTATGSGVIVTKDGLVVTNNHVVADSNGTPVEEVKVRLSDKRSFKAKVVGTDPRSDIAVLRIAGNDFSPIDMGRSDQLQTGQWVMAVGNPLGFDDTVSVGVVSSLKRDLPLQNGGIVNAIQTDAAINPGNSGGALTDQYGKLVGINAAIASGNGGSVGIGFAIPIDRVREVVDDIVKYGHARYGSLGVDYWRNADGALGDAEVREYIAQQTGASVGSVPTTGIIVHGSGGPSETAGIKPLDVLQAVDGTPVDTYFSLNRALITKKPGDKIQVKWWSRGQTKTATVTLQEAGGEIN